MQASACYYVRWSSLFCWVLLLATTATHTALAVTGPQLLINAGMQTGTNPISSVASITGSAPTSWFDNSDWASPAPVLKYTLVNTNPRTTAGSRNWCVQVGSAAGSFAQSGQGLYVKAGINYSLSVYVRVQAAATSSTQVTVAVGLQAGYSPWPLWGYANKKLTKASGWQQVTAPLLTSLPVRETGSSSSSLVPALFLIYVQTPGVTVCVDDAVITERVMCSGNPASPKAVFSCPLTSVGASCSANCTSTPGTLSVTCLSSGAWSDVTGSCGALATKCGGVLPAAPANSLAWPAACNGTAFGGVCRTNCSAGFTGAPNTTCLSGGSWSAAAGTCTPTACGGVLPAAPANSLAWPAACNGTAIGGVCRTNCSAGFTGAPNTTCLSGGSWSAAAGTCTPTAAAANELHNPGFEEGSAALTSGGSISGSLANWWVDNSNWASPVPTLVYSVATDIKHTGARSQCVQVVSGFAQMAQSLPLSTHFNYSASVWVLVKTAPAISSLVTVRVALQQAFSPWSWLAGTSSTTLTFASGWTQLRVPGLPKLTQADPANPGSTAPTLLLVVVDTPGTTVCVDDAAVTPLGGVTCPQGGPTNPANGAFDCSGIAHVGDVCTATCAAGFWPATSGAPTATCMSSGAWVAGNGSCVSVVCAGNPTQPSYGTFACAATTRVGERCNATCSAGFTGDPAPYAVCSDSGSWVAMGQCVRPNFLQNGGFESGARTISYNAGSISSSSMPDSWDDNSGSQVPSPILRYTTPTDMPRSPASNRTLCVNITQGAAFLVQASTLNASTDYAVSAWALVRAAPAGDLPITLRLALQAAFAPRTTLGEAAVVLTQEMGWSQLSLPNLAQLPSVDPAKPAGGAPVLFVLSVDAAAPPGTTVCFDDARLSVPYGVLPELLANANFNGGTYTWSAASGSGVMAHGWGDNTEWVTPPVSIQTSMVSGAEARSGSALKLQILSGFSQFAQFTSVASGTAYRLSIWARASGMSVTLYLRVAGPPYTSFGTTTAVVGANWTQLVVPVAVVPAGSGSSVSVGFFVSTGGTGTLWLDDASLTAVPSNQALPTQVLSTPLSSPINMDYFCQNFNHMFGGWFTHVYQGGYAYPSMDLLPHGIFRTWDSEIVWPSIQPYNTTHFEWTNMDYIATQAAARGVKILFTLGQSPTWASSNATLQSVYGPGRGSPPANITHWTNFVRALIRRYPSLILAVEPWNECNLQGPTGFYNGSPEQMAALALATQQVLREEASSALLLNPPMAGTAADAVSFLNRYFAECARLGVTTQGIAWHSYNMPAELDVDSVATLRGIMAVHGLPADLPIFNTEAGILDNVFAAMGNDHRLGAAYLAKVYVLNYAVGVGHVCWYAFDAATMEGLDASTTTRQVADQLNVAGQAYRRVVGWLQGASLVSTVRTQGVWIASLARTAGGITTTSWVMWNGDARVAAQQLTVPAAWNVRYVEDLLTGVLTPLTPGVTAAVAVDNTPMLLRQA